MNKWLLIALLFMGTAQAKTLTSPDGYNVQEVVPGLVPAFQLLVKSGDQSAMLNCATSPNQPNLFLCWFSDQ